MKRKRYPRAIKEWPEEERPRERLLKYGPQQLTTAELLGILCRTGVRGQSAVDLGRELLHTFGGLRGLSAADAHDLRAIKGLGSAKIAELQAALELGRRSLSEAKQIKGKVESSEDVHAFLLPQMRDLKREVFRVLLLNGQNEIVDVRTASEGSLTESPVYPREIMRLANRHHAAALIVAPNHPPGKPQTECHRQGNHRRTGLRREDHAGQGPGPCYHRGRSLLQLCGCRADRRVRARLRPPPRSPP